MSMSKVTETRTQDDLREAITPLNLGNYLHDLEQHAKQTGQLEDLKINYVLNKKSENSKAGHTGTGPDQIEVEARDRRRSDLS